MFGKKRHQQAGKSTILNSPPPATSATDILAEAANKLADSLSTYSEVAYRASKDIADPELVEATAKLVAARKLVREGRIAYARLLALPYG